MFSQKSLMFVVFLLRISLPVVGLNFEDRIDFSDEYKQLQDQKLREADAEFPEYLRRLKDPSIKMESPIQAPMPFPSIQLCKERPADGDYYGHIFCWTMVSLFAMTIISLIIYQIRSILWLKFAISRNRQHQKEFELVPHGQQSDYKDFESESDNKQGVPRMLPV